MRNWIQYHQPITNRILSLTQGIRSETTPLCVACGLGGQHLLWMSKCCGHLYNDRTSSCSGRHCCRVIRTFCVWRRICISFLWGLAIEYRCWSWKSWPKTYLCHSSDSHWKYFYSKTNQENSISNLFYFETILYLFRTVSPSIIRSLRLYIQHHTIQVLWLLASKKLQKLYGMMLYVQS
jgi:hypothetical protein